MRRPPQKTARTATCCPYARRCRSDRRQRRVGALGRASGLALGVLATMLLLAAAQPGGDGGLAAVYRIGDWPARFGIVLVVDRLSALMRRLASVRALAVL